MDQPQPKNVELISPFLFHIAWRDGARSDYKARDLRLACPCASCVDEQTGRPLLDPSTVRDDVMLLDVYTQVYVWVGSASNEQEQRMAMDTAEKYVRGAADATQEQVP